MSLNVSFDFCLQEAPGEYAPGAIIKVYLFMEEWKDVPGYEGLYQINIAIKEGRCRRFLKNGKTKLLSSNQSQNGRIYWELWKNGTGKRQQAARWIAVTFPELVENDYFEGAQIDHKDTNRTNNHPSNLRWVTNKENCNNPLTRKHISDWQKGKKITETTRQKISSSLKGKRLSEETKNKMRKKHIGKLVSQYTFDGEYISTFKSITEAYRATGVDTKSIKQCCEGERKTAGKYMDQLTNKVYGYTWKYA